MKEKDIKNEEELEEKTEIDIDIDQDNMTREINLDDLYDGAINSTVIIDPISNNETLVPVKKNNYTILGIVLAILILLSLYYINNKTDLISKNNVKVSTTTKAITTKKVTDKGTLTCNYNSKSDAETQEVTYTANYISDKITNSEFNFVAISNTDSKSAVIDDLTTQYETLYLNNLAVSSNTISFDKNNKGFTFNIKTDYQKTGFNEITTAEGQTILFIKPTLEDTIKSLQDAYTKKGFNCLITYDEKD